jgi:hypothetical protein
LRYILKKTKSVNQINAVQYRNKRWGGLVNAEIKLRVPYEAKNFVNT